MAFQFTGKRSALSLKLTLILHIEFLLFLSLPIHSFSQSWEPLGPDSVPAFIRLHDFSLKVAQGIGRVSMVRFGTKKNKISEKIFVGAPYGGLWESDDEAKHWTSVNTDQLPNIGIADLAVHPKNSKIMYVATGDPDCIPGPGGPSLSSESCQSRGIVKSIDCGRTWTKEAIGIWHDSTGTPLKDFWKYPSLKFVRKLLIHPKRAGTLFTILSTYSGSDHAYYGYVYRSKDGGLNWYISLQVRGEMLKDIEFSPRCSDMIYVSGKNIYKTTNAGDTWSSISQNGLPPDSVISRCELAVCPNSPKRVYSLIVNSKTRKNDFYLSEDEGRNFKLTCSGQASPEWRTAFAVHPFFPDQVYFSGGNKVHRFTKRGSSWTSAMVGAPIHDDLHDLTFDPEHGTLYASNDGGLYSTSDSGTTWTSCSRGLNVAECWNVAVSQTEPLSILAGLQDCGTIRYRETSDSSGGWFIVRGGDGMKPAIDPTNDSIYYYNDGNNNISARSPDRGLNWSGNLLPQSRGAVYLRPVALDEKNPRTIYTAFHELYKSNDRGDHWKAISSFTDVPDNEAICAFALSPSDTNVICVAFANPSWTDSVFQKLYLTKDGGNTWMDISYGLRAASWTNISCLAIHPLNPEVIYVGFRGGWTMKVMRTTSGGRGPNGWQDFSEGLPDDADANTLLFDRDDQLTLFVGTHTGVFKCREDESVWTSFNTGLPRVMILDLAIRYKQRELFAGTHGRGVWRIKIPK